MSPTRLFFFHFLFGSLTHRCCLVLLGLRYVGAFTGRVFAFLENATGLGPELSLQADCAAADALLDIPR